MSEQQALTVREALLLHENLITDAVDKLGGYRSDDYVARRFGYVTADVHSKTGVWSYEIDWRDITDVLVPAVREYEDAETNTNVLSDALRNLQEAMAWVAAMRKEMGFEP